MISDSRTVGMVRLLTSLRLTRKTPGRVPHQQQPDAIRLEYYKAILANVVEPITAAFAGAKAEILRLLIEEGRFKLDSPREVAARALVEQAERHAVNIVNGRDLHAVAEKFGRRTSDFNRAQLDRQARSAIGVSIGLIEKPTRDLLPLFSTQNVELIKTISDRYFDRIAKDVREAFETGMHPTTLAERFAELEDISENDARRIARDQIGKLNGQFNEQRQQAMGVTSYVWRTARDNRVRDEHRHLDGRTFEWSNPPPDGHPGEPIQCRCFAEPVFDDILAGLS
jgi:SPP1 gp7 family putative phage head morphogenesis protein